jgi:Ala-tRNA(Pro) deacylase
MPPVDERLQKLLDDNEVEYEVIHHTVDTRAHATATHTHTEDRDFAKTVVVWVDGARAFAVVPASHHVAPSRLARSLGADEVRLATEAEMAESILGCDLGAEPPFGNLFGVPTYASPVLARDDRITFNGGTHRDAVRMRWADYERLAKPRVVPLSRHEEDTH